MLHAKCSITGNKHSTMEVAKEACKNDKKCDGLLSQQCENDGDYHICLNNGTIEYGDTISSCVYEKQIRGMHQKLLIFSHLLNQICINT